MQKQKIRRTKRINVQVTPEEYQFIQDVARKHMVTVANLMREALYRSVALESHAQKN